MSNSKNSIAVGMVIILPLVVIILSVMMIYNGLVAKEEQVISSWSQVESNYQRRADLIPNLVKTVKQFAEQEKTVLMGVAEARGGVSDFSKMASELSDSQKKASELINGSKDKLDDETYMVALANAQQNVSAGVSRLFGLVENYPQLRSSDNFLALQDQLEGTENRINVARMAFNDDVRAYNAAIRKMPASLIAGFGSFQRKAYFEAAQGADTNVNVEF